MEKKNEILLEKFKAAQTIRKEKRSWHDAELDEKIKERLQEIKVAEKINDLEIEAKVAWKFRESRKMINAQKRVLEGRIQVEMLKLKIKRDLARQQKKIIRTDKPKRPRLEPLPYLNKKNQSFIDSQDKSDEEVVEEVPIRAPYGLKFEYGSGNTPSPSKNTKFTKKRHISPDVIRLKL